jgi:endonuclease/exonuclease/phosphatase family metal-dependent hydrolase
MERLKLLTLNIWNRQGPWSERLRLIRREITTLAPDVVGLQEVLRLESGGQPPAGSEHLKEADQAHQIADGLGYYAAYASAWHVGGGLQFGNAVLSRFPILHARNIPLPVGEAGEETRAALFVELDAPCGRVPVFNTHLNWKLHQGNVRERQVAFLVEQIHELAPVGGPFPPVLMGDFNAEPDADEMRYLRGLTSRLGRSVYFADCFLTAGDGTPGYTFDRSNRFAAIAREPNRRIDYIYVRGPDRQLRGEPLVSRVVCAEPEGDVFPSDHFGVYAEIQAAPRPIG